jgi:divalent metal cation (Fe/Co/Zn/Cd) transporter
MNSEIERLDRRRMRYLEWYLMGCLVFIILSVTRYFFRLGDLNASQVGKAVLYGLILSLLVLAVSSLASVRLGKKINQDPALKEALNNELVQALDVQSWKAAFFGAVGTTLFFALSWFFYPVCDPVMAALTTIIVGLGSYQGTFYFKYRSL